MKNVMHYKGYVGSVEFSEEDNLFFGSVQGIHSLVSYEGENAKALVKDFHDAVDDFLILCEEHGIDPETSYKGNFNVRIPSELHRDAAVYAMEHEQTLNSFVADAIRSKLAGVVGA